MLKELNDLYNKVTYSYQIKSYIALTNYNKKWINYDVLFYFYNNKTAYFYCLLMRWFDTANFEEVICNEKCDDKRNNNTPCVLKKWCRMTNVTINATTQPCVCCCYYFCLSCCIIFPPVEFADSTEFSFDWWLSSIGRRLSLWIARRSTLCVNWSLAAPRSATLTSATRTNPSSP